MIQYGNSLAFASVQKYQTQQTSLPTTKPVSPDVTATGQVAKIEQTSVGDEHAEQIAKQQTAIQNKRAESFAKELQAGAAGVQVSVAYSFSASGVDFNAQAFPTELTSGFLGSLPQSGVVDNDSIVASVDHQFEQAVSASGYAGFGGTGEFSFSFQAEINTSSLSSSFSFSYSYVFQGSVSQPPIEQPPVDDVPASQLPDTITAPDSSPPVVDGTGTTTPPTDDVPVPSEDPVAPVLRKRVYSDTVNIHEKFERTSQGGEQRIEQLDVQDFKNFRSVEKTRQLETSLQLELKTNDGDIISLDFSQIESIVKNGFRGRTSDGERVHSRSIEEDLQRVVNISVEGDISAEEQAAIDKVIATVIEVANSFFTGDVGAAVEKLQALDFDGEQLAELSLGMSLTKSVSVSRAYQRNGEALQDLKVRDQGIAQALDFLAAEQKRLIEVAKEIFDAPSAAKLVRSLVPVLTSDPFAKLSEAFTKLNDIEQRLTEPGVLPEQDDLEDDLEEDA